KRRPGRNNAAVNTPLTPPQEPRTMSGMQPNGPSRKALLRSSEAAGALRPFAVLALDMGLFAGGSILALAVVDLWLKLLGSALIAAGIVRLFLVGRSE